MKTKISNHLSGLLNGPLKPFVPLKTVSIKIHTLSVPEIRFILKNLNNRNVSNRRIGLNTVKKYAQDMKDENWLYTGEPIIFTKDGDLIQGQHRLFAALMTEKPLKTAVSMGVPTPVFKVLDQVKNRTLGDVLYTQGVKSNEKVLATTAKLVWAFENNRMIGSQTGDTLFTRNRGLQTVEGHPEIIEYLDRYIECSLIGKGGSAFLYWLFSKEDRKRAENYLDKVLLGVGLKPETVEYNLNRKLIRNTQKQRKLTRTAVLANIVHGWRKVTGKSKSSPTNLDTVWDERSGKFPDPFK